MNRSDSFIGALNYIDKYQKRFVDEKAFKSYFGIDPMILINGMSNGVWCVAHNAINRKFDEAIKNNESISLDDFNLECGEYIGLFEIRLVRSDDVIHFTHIFHLPLTIDITKDFGIGRNIFDYNSAWFLNRNDAVKAAEKLIAERLLKLHSKK